MLDAMSAPPPTPGAELDAKLHAWQGRFTGGRSPSTLGLAFADWGAHAANAPFQMAEIFQSSFVQWQRLAAVAMGGAPALAPKADDRRFADPAWQKPPFAVLTQAALLGEAWWDSLVQRPGGVDPQNRRLVAFTVQQMFDLIAPSNMPWLNPQVIAATRASGGANLAAGLEHAIHARDKPVLSAFRIGIDVAATPGKVVFRNSLIELIQYTPTTSLVGAEPVLIIPAWIMKYYILDLSPGNSLIRWLVEQGRTVFAISWRNPDASMRDTTLDDYRIKGVMAAVDAIEQICPLTKIHATGYCLGGTLLAIAAAAMARAGDNRLASLSLFAAQTDFTEAGDLKLFITEDQLDFLADVVRGQGFLSSEQMGGAFQILRPNDLIWAPLIKNYWLGEKDVANDLMAWDADGTRLPAQMHIEYLKRLFLHNDLAEGRFAVGGQPLALGDIHLPIFVVGTERDTIAPWRSVFKLHGLNDGAITFVLTSGGHNAGIVSEPGHNHRHFRLRTREAGAPTPGPTAWEQETAPQDGSWWVEWGAWLASRSGPATTPPAMGAALCDAPGTYVLET